MSYGKLLSDVLLLMLYVLFNSMECSCLLLKLTYNQGETDVNYGMGRYPVVFFIGSSHACFFFIKHYNKSLYKSLNCLQVKVKHCGSNYVAKTLSESKITEACRLCKTKDSC